MGASREWIEVDVLTRAAGVQLPDDMCANCGTGDDLELGAMLVLGRARVRVGTCRSCAPTMTKPLPGLGDRVMLALALFPGLLVVGMVVLIVGRLRDGMSAVSLGAMVAAVIGQMLWFRRRARPPRTSNYQPIRFVRHLRDTNGSGAPGLRLAFSNPAYAARVARAVGAVAIPEARVVRLPVRSAPDTRVVPPTACEAVRGRLLAAIAEAPEPRGSRRASRGLAMGEAAVRSVAIEDDPRGWIANVLAALATLRAETEDDDDGWVYGGIATVRRAAEDVQAELSPRG